MEPQALSWLGGLAVLGLETHCSISPPSEFVSCLCVCLSVCPRLCLCVWLCVCASLCVMYIVCLSVCVYVSISVHVRLAGPQTPEIILSLPLSTGATGMCHMAGLTWVLGIIAPVLRLAWQALYPLSHSPALLLHSHSVLLGCPCLNLLS